jgi:hypothetical protein
LLLAYASFRVTHHNSLSQILILSLPERDPYQAGDKSGAGQAIFGMSVEVASDLTSTPAPMVS